MPVIQANLLAGRTQEQKDAFHKAVAQAAVDTLNVKPEQVRVIIQEYAMGDWSVGGVTKAQASS